ncbi:Hypothetical Protein RRSL_03922 [Ralstonia solanacearum UW551]|uniref:Uncharacterized protein n=1 Tax=Ralstonia solanacearum (strain UW551) TaxID=342110 RepID=A0AB33VHB7_RALSU|nr:Hypothetical Protein RRSL_03922 [Ralstonia solanacearum UW551]
MACMMPGPADGRVAGAESLVSRQRRSVRGTRLSQSLPALDADRRLRFVPRHTNKSTKPACPNADGSAPRASVRSASRTTLRISAPNS